MSEYSIETYPTNRGRFTARVWKGDRPWAYFVNRTEEDATADAELHCATKGVLWKLITNKTGVVTVNRRGTPV